MVIILEGVDRNGKTNFANKLIEKYPEYNFKYYHFTNTGRDAWEEYWEYLEKDLTKFQENGENIILDRYYVMAMIYDKLFRNKQSFNYLKLSDLEHALWHMHSVIVQCEVPLDLNWKMIQDENEGIITDKETLNLQRQCLNLLLSLSTLPVVKYDFTKDSFDEKSKEAIDKAFHR